MSSIDAATIHGRLEQIDPISLPVPSSYVSEIYRSIPFHRRHEHRNWPV